ncbi:MAG: hypothetical protein OEV73_12060 [Desulfobulbaceae bacterium]|nr:hypothetical protein [Desulfobulbaceae bacterium]
MMNIGNEKEALDAIDSIRQEPLRAQLRTLQLSIESMELGQMYYDQKGNEQGSERLARCLRIVAERKKEIERALEDAETP